MAWDIGAFEYVSSGITVSSTQAATVGESASLSLLTVHIHASLTEAVTVGESVTVSLTTVHIHPSVTDAVTVGESVSLKIGLPIVTTEAVTVGESRTLRLKAWYQPNALTPNTGSVTSGTVESAWADDGNILELTEVSGTPAFSYDFSYTDVPDDRAESVQFIGRYDGNPAHIVWIRQYNFDSTNWEDLVEIPSSGSEGTITHALISGTGSYWESGEIRLRIIHTSAGNPIHVLYIDAFVLTSLPAVHVTEAVSVGENAAVGPPITIRYATSVSESVTVGEEAIVGPPITVLYSISASESVTVGEEVTVTATSVGASAVDVSEAVTVGETAKVVVDPVAIHASESVTVGESASGFTTPILVLPMKDTGTVGEVVTLVWGWEIVVTDALTVSETVSVAVDLFSITVTDGATVGEVVKAVVDPVAIHATETVTVGESASASTGITAITVSVTEAVTVGERRYVTVYYYTLILAINETVTWAHPVNTDFHSAQPVDVQFTVAEPFNQDFLGERD